MLHTLSEILKSILDAQSLKLKRKTRNAQNLEILKLRNLEKLSGRLSTLKTFFFLAGNSILLAGLFFFLVLQNFILAFAAMLDAGDG